MNHYDFIYGPGSSGSDDRTRALTSKLMFVRSQMQIALDTPAATGRRLTALEAFDAFGAATLATVAEEGSATIISSTAEPAATLRKRRQFLGLSPKTLAAVADVSREIVVAAEEPGEILPIQVLERIAQELALDERVLGAVPMARADAAFGARLKALNPSEDRQDYFVTALADAGWTIRRQRELARMLDILPDAERLFSAKDDNFNFPTYEHAYMLADKTRRLLGISLLDPIPSIQALAQDRLGIAVIDADLGDNYLGATIASQAVRGIVINGEGPNRSPFIRRNTIAHELAHLLWDPGNAWDSIRVESERRPKRETDPVEIRANAFAVELLAPREAVRTIYASSDSFAHAVETIVSDYGISPSAAARHVANACDVDFRTVSYKRSIDGVVDSRWRMSERRDIFGENLVRASRAGPFAQLTVTAAQRGLISADSAAAWLRTTTDTVAFLMTRLGPTP